jgi:hypothetical protein
MASSSSSSSTSNSNSNNNNNNNSNDGTEDIPICCEFVKEIGLFRVLRAKGKALASGGFGVAIAEPGSKNDSPPEEVVLPPPTKAAATGTTNHPLSKPSDFLFIEEVIFLFERGLLQCLAPNSSSSATTTTTTTTTTAACLDSSQLYQLLLPLGVSLPIYFTYAHLRKQDYRVLRHAPERLALLQLQQQQQDTVTSYQQTTQSLRHQVRDSIQRAAPPTIPKDDDAPTTIAWDVYSPNSDFAKTKPGIPDFYVAVSYFNAPSLSFQQLQTLLVTKCHGIPFKIATVSDSGTIVMFGLDNFGAPPIVK